MVDSAPITPPLGEDLELDWYAHPILDAAIEQFALHAIRRTTVDGMAAAPRVGRVTVYRLHNLAAATPDFGQTRDLAR